MSRLRFGTRPALLAACLVLSATAGLPETPFRSALAAAEQALAKGELERAREEVLRALERDPQSRAAWALRSRWAEAAKNEDELVFALHRELRLAEAQRADRSEREALRARLATADPLAANLLDMRVRFVERLLPIATKYEADGRRHGAIRVHREILSMDPDRAESAEAIQRLAAAPDPSLADEAKTTDLLEGVSAEWIREHDEDHASWAKHAKQEGENYETHTNAGYAVLVRASEAMDQMNAFYRRFFRFGTEEDGGSVPRIDLNIFRTREEYLKVASADEWSAGNFTGSAVNTYISEGGFEDTVGTLFHEAAHQFVSLATKADGWLNEGLASFFEGCRILPNGTVRMNLPATHRLIPLVQRLQNGWMTSHEDGIDPNEPKTIPGKAPTLGIIIEDRYEWGPAWYPPTWGLVYFFYNFRDPVDGRYLYRDAFWVFVDKSAGRAGSGAIQNFEELVLASPAPPTKGVDVRWHAENLPKTTAEMDEIWKQWLFDLHEEQLGRVRHVRPWLDWGRYAVKRGDRATALDHFEKGLLEQPENAELLVELADFLAAEPATVDRAAKLLLQGLSVLEAEEAPDAKRLEKLEKQLAKLDPAHEGLGEIRAELAAAADNLVRRYLSGGKLLMGMDLARRLGAELDMPGMFALYEEAARRGGGSSELWRLAYDEQSLAGWAGSAVGDFKAAGAELTSSFTQAGGAFDYRFLTVDTITSGDFSLEAEIQTKKGEVGYCGLVFGRKTDTTFHAALFFPGKKDAGATAGSGFIDLTSFYGGGEFKTWRHTPTPPGAGEEAWTRLRIDITGAIADVWHDGRFLATQDFGDADVLRGSFGLITGPGKARWRNVRFLPRAARDRAAAIERAIRLEGIADEGGSVGGSWLGKVPPFPTVSRWVQGARASWKETGPVPQLLVLWSIHQNDLIPLEPWLAHLQEQHGALGLEIVCVASPLDEQAIDAYLPMHPFPGAVAVDRFPDAGGIGITFETFAVGQFNLPRLVLFDIDGTVAWEGDPGFKVGLGWDPSAGSYLDAPLADLLARRRLAEIGPWQKRWESGGKSALAAGRLADALPLLLEARSFDGKMYAAVRDAQAKLAALEAAVSSTEAAAHSLEREEAEPAVHALVAFALHLEKPIDERHDRAVRALKASQRSKDWKKALDLLKPLTKRLDAGKDVGDLSALLAELDALGGRFPRALAESLRAADGDPVRLREAVSSAPDLPARWLISDYFNW